MYQFESKELIYRALERVGSPPLGGELERLRANQEEPWVAGQLELLRRRAEEYLGSPTPELPYQLFRRYWEDGDRAHYERAYFERRGRLLVFSVLCWLEPQDARYLHALEDILWTICAEPFWCIPAHFTSFTNEKIPFEQYHNHLDLFSTETGFAIAEALALCERRLAPDVARQAQLQLEKRIFDPWLDGRTAYKFEGMRNNWAAVCGGAIGGAALYRLSDRYALASVLHRCLGCMRVYLDSFGMDGVCEEGVGYWTYGFGFFTCFADLLEKRTAGAVDLFAEPKVAAIAKSQQLFYLSGANTLSFSDGYEHSGFRMGLSCFLQKRYPDAAIPDARYAEEMLGDTCYRYCLALRDLIWYDPRARFGLPGESAAWLPDVEWFLSRTARIQLAAKAGHNGESHNHNDCGSFLLLKQGEPLLCDLGAGLYNAEYFGPNRYGVFVNASRSHNLPLIAGTEQVEGRNAASSDVRAELGATDTLTMELSGCYRAPGLQSFRRQIRHRRGEGVVELIDAFRFSEPQSVAEVFCSRTPIRLEGATALFARGGAELRMDCPAGLSPELREERYFDHYGEEQTAYLLHLKSEPVEELEVRLRFA